MNENKSVFGIKFSFLKYKSFRTIDIIFVTLIALGILSAITCALLTYNYQIGNPESMKQISLLFLGISFIIGMSYFGYKVGTDRGFIILSDYIEFRNKEIIIFKNQKEQIFKLNEIENIKIIYNGPDDFFAHWIFDIPIKHGNRNHLLFDYFGQRQSYEFYISSKKKTQILKKILLNWQKQGIHYQLKKIEING